MGLSWVLFLNCSFSAFSSFLINLLWTRGLAALLQVWYFCCAASCLCSVPRPKVTWVGLWPLVVAYHGHGLSTSTVVPTKSDSDVIFCLQEFSKT